MSRWSNTNSSKVPLIGILITIAVGCAIIAILTTVCLVVVCKRKGGHVPPPAGPAHWSTTVTVAPDCRTGARSQEQTSMQVSLSFTYCPQKYILCEKKFEMVITLTVDPGP